MLVYGARRESMLNIFAGTSHKVGSNQQPKGLINQAITHSMIKADDALMKEQYKDAHKFYKYALRLSEMQFGEQDSIVKNLRLLLKGIEEFLGQGPRKPQMVAEAGWRKLSN